VTPGHGQRIVLLGMMSKMPVGGVVWQTVHYLLGFRRLGYDIYYVEAHGRTPSMFMKHERDHGARKAADYIAGVMHRFGLEDRWAYQALHDDGHTYGLSDSQLRQLYASASLIVNLHGGTEPLPEHIANGRLVYLETDPVELQVQIHRKRQQALEFLEPHIAFFTFAENYGREGYGLPPTPAFPFRPTRQPVVLDLWATAGSPAGDAFTTVGNWQQPWRDIRFRGEVYHWSKHREFLKFLDLPARSGRPFELALSGYDDEERQLLESHGWRVRPALDFSFDLDAYRRYIQASRGEFTVAKDQNVRLRTGWFSDRSATYLAAGRPVITQDTGFTSVLPTGRGLFAYSTTEDVLEAREAIESDPESHARAARELAHGYFAHDVVLGALLDDLGLPARVQRGVTVPRQPPGRLDNGQAALPPGLVLEPLSRRPMRLPERTVRRVLRRPIPRAHPTLGLSGNDTSIKVSIVMVTWEHLLFTRLCLESLLANSRHPGLEVIVVDNGSEDGTGRYLRELARRHPRLRVIFNRRNLGFAPAVNRGLASARGDVLVILNNDTIPAAGWLGPLLRHLQEPSVGLVGPVTNRCGNEAEVDTSYKTYGELRRFAREHMREHRGRAFDIRTLTMFCCAMRREVHEDVGPLDERFEVGLFEDEDYSIRVRRAGLRVLCAEGAFVHHFGQGSFGDLVPSGEYGRLFEENRQRLEEKWGIAWEPYARRGSPEYLALRERIKHLVLRELPSDATVVIVSKGDDDLLRLDGRRGWHFPQQPDGSYAGHYPADSREAIAALEALQAKGAQYLLIPGPSFWWLDHYPGLRRHLEDRCRMVASHDDTCVVFELEGLR
jgi:GT2 family glycosyltransferase